MNHFRHGDLSFAPTEKRDNLEEVKFDKSFVLALGEHTGHKHVIEGDVQIFKDEKGNIFFNVGEKGAKITHEEHKEITLVPSWYKMNNEREFDYFLGEVRRVQD